MFNSVVKPGVFKHIKCRNNIYPKSDIERFKVPDDLVFWNIQFLDYSPPFYTAPFIKNQVWADPDIGDDKFKPNWNKLDGNVNRESHNGIYEINNRYPLNPFGRTGLRGRGLLGRWGPNHAADPIVTRWKRDLSNQIIVNSETNK